jgi:hypothetical protein
VTPAHAILNYCFALLEAESRLAIAALGNMTYHVASGAGADFKVFEVWESEQHAQKFGALLKPIQRHSQGLNQVNHEPMPSRRIAH